MIAVHTVSREAPTDSVRDVVGRVAPMIAYALEPLRSLTEVARVVSSAHSGIVLTRRGDLVALVGMSNHPP
jgi:hypothetical protein